MVRYAGYLRVSKDSQDNTRQEILIKNWLDRNEVEKCELFQEKASSKKSRPIKYELLNLFRGGSYDVILVGSISRWSRTLSELVIEVQEIVDKGGRIVFIQENLDLTKKKTDPITQLMLHIFGAFAQFERDILSERTKQGMEVARRNGKTCHRPKGSKDKKKRKRKRVPPAERKFVRGSPV